MFATSIRLKLAAPLFALCLFAPGFQELKRPRRFHSR